MNDASEVLKIFHPQEIKVDLQSVKVVVFNPASIDSLSWHMFEIVVESLIRNGLNSKSLLIARVFEAACAIGES